METPDNDFIKNFRFDINSYIFVAGISRKITSLYKINNTTFEITEIVDYEKFNDSNYSTILPNRTSLINREFFDKYIEDYKEICTKTKILQITKFTYGHLKFCNNNLASLVHHIQFNIKHDLKISPISDFEINRVHNSGLYVKYNNNGTVSNTNTTTRDINGFYSYLGQLTYQFAKASGEFKKLTNEEFEKFNFYNLAYFLVDVKKGPFYLNDIDNKTIWLTNYDVMTFKLLKCEFSISDVTNNSYVYAKENIIRNNFFESFFKELSKLKINGNIAAKFIISNFYGLMFQKIKPKKTLVHDEDYDENLHDVLTRKDGTEYLILKTENIKAIKGSEGYTREKLKFNICRNQAFFYSFVRLKSIAIFLPIIEHENTVVNVIYCDSIAYTEKVKTDIDYLGDKSFLCKIENKKWNGTNGIFHKNTWEAI